jgi:hypothetical protein
MLACFNWAMSLFNCAFSAFTSLMFSLSLADFLQSYWKDWLVSESWFALSFQLVSALFLWRVYRAISMLMKLIFSSNLRFSINSSVLI